MTWGRSLRRGGSDLGCGSGHITAHLRRLRLRAVGIDASPSMIGLAQEANPELRFEVGAMAALDIADGAQDLPAVVAESARVLPP
ncbi:class I SAM-dependent methyltransferase [Streptomyces sp. AC154]|uniref:class I SAM-dependent methyltransferase n=1 Tax=Streptomyces sp. AC154 TaxID=3143184 RepID=UPI003F810A78